MESYKWMLAIQGLTITVTDFLNFLKSASGCGINVEEARALHSIWMGFKEKIPTNTENCVTAIFQGTIKAQVDFWDHYMPLVVKTARKMGLRTASGMDKITDNIYENPNDFLFDNETDWHICCEQNLTLVDKSEATELKRKLQRLSRIIHDVGDAYTHLEETLPDRVQVDLQSVVDDLKKMVAIIDGTVQVETTILCSGNDINAAGRVFTKEVLIQAASVSLDKYVKTRDDGEVELVQRIKMPRGLPNVDQGCKP